jgi:hypothetical protein
MFNARRTAAEHACGEPCPGCATSAADERWPALPLLRTMNAVDVAPFISTPWGGRVIEVRQCAWCGRGIARLVPPRKPRL